MRSDVMITWAGYTPAMPAGAAHASASRRNWRSIFCHQSSSININSFSPSILELPSELSNVDSLSSVSHDPEVEE